MTDWSYGYLNNWQPPLSTGKSKQRGPLPPVPDAFYPPNERTYSLVYRKAHPMTELVLYGVGALTLGVVAVLLWGQRRRGEI